jgi:hypothetical protein
MKKGNKNNAKKTNKESEKDKQNKVKERREANWKEIETPTNEEQENGTGA